MSTVPGHHFLADDLEGVTGGELDLALVASHNQVTDLHLLALARRHELTLATFDRGIWALARGEGVVLVPFD